MCFSRKNHLIFIQPLEPALSPAPRTVDRKIEATPAPCGEQGNPKQIILGNWGTLREITRVRGTPGQPPSERSEA